MRGNFSIQLLFFLAFMVPANLSAIPTSIITVDEATVSDKEPRPRLPSFEEWELWELQTIQEIERLQKIRPIDPKPKKSKKLKS